MRLRFTKGMLVGMGEGVRGMHSISKDTQVTVTKLPNGNYQSVEKRNGSNLIIPHSAIESGAVIIVA